MRLSFSESDIDPKTQLSPAMNQAAADHIAKQELAAGWVDPDKTRVVSASELAAWHATATPPRADRATSAKDAADRFDTDAEKDGAEKDGAEKDGAEKDGAAKEQKTFLGLSLPQVIGGVLASTTAAILGGQLGVAGTVVGAAMTSGIITVGGAVYGHFINKTSSGLGAVAGRFRLGGTTPLKNVPDVSADATEVHGATEVLGGHDQEHPGSAGGKGQSWRDKISPLKLLAAAAAIFLLAAVVVTGLEALRGESFSGGGQTTVGQIGEQTPVTSSDSDSGVTESQREVTEPAADPTPADATTSPTPTTEPTPTPGEPTAPASGSGNTSTDSGSTSGDGTAGAGGQSGQTGGDTADSGSSTDSGTSGSDTPQGGPNADGSGE